MFMFHSVIFNGVDVLLILRIFRESGFILSNFTTLIQFFFLNATGYIFYFYTDFLMNSLWLRLSVTSA